MDLLKYHIPPVTKSKSITPNDEADLGDRKPGV